MKTYILCDPESVQPQKHHVESPNPQRAVRGPALYIGLDMHTDSIAVSLAPSDSTEVRRYGLIGSSRAAWGFEQMRQIVGRAMDWQPAPEPRPEQEWL